MGSLHYSRYEQTRKDPKERRAARFITGDYKSREGSVTKMLAELELESLQSRRTSQQLIVLYKVVEGLVPAIKPEDYLTKSRQRSTIKPKRFDDYVNTSPRFLCRLTALIILL
jgi:hypothetical protein